MSRRSFAGRRLADQPGEVAAILLDQMLERPQVVRHAGQNLLFGQPFGQRDFDRAVERQFAAVDRCSVSTVARIAKSQPSTVRRNRLRVTSIFLASEISSSRVSSGISAIWLRYIRIGSSLSFGKLRPAAGTAPRAPQPSALPRAGGGVRLGFVEHLRRRLVDQLDAHFFQGDQQIVELFGRDVFVGQIAVDFVVGQITLSLALLNEFLQFQFVRMHVCLSSALSCASRDT